MNTEVNASNKRQLTLILAIPVLVVAFSSVMFFLAQKNIISLGNINRGVLVQPPAELPLLKLKREDGSEFLFNLAESKWVYMVAGGQTCVAECERMLYLTRQTHIALGKKTNRVERVYLALDGQISDELKEELKVAHSDISVLYAERAAFLNSLPQLDINPEAANVFYVVDPRGWLMMYYQAEDTELMTLTSLGKDILKDMKRLLR
ncbi:hypothetical protein IB286_00970 [Spongiibacter sp. KMU-158]|uniref:Cytochrome oxidase Cu insertion factor (SCO1/SenC/PrrC family) n=1 Tax=Spongiibacter pelagi TaxID=2760804 RepID=A0A927BYV1_9GAMM|nr:hypothetical protein [Spongiibacter pelagi]MBD2857559.1 hypothetical protein [Spongiibacter pelagi]